MNDPSCRATGFDPCRESVYRPILCRLESVTDLTPVEKHFRLSRTDGRPFGHQPGQFVQVSVFGVGEAPISVASSPTRTEHLDLGVRRVGDLTEALHRLVPGDEVGIRGPFGKGFDLAAMSGKDLVLVSGGCGLAPMRALVQYCEDHREEFGAVTLLIGAKTPGDMLFWEDVRHWEEVNSLDCSYTVDRVPTGEPWQGRVGLITELLSGLKMAPENTVAVIVGPPMMYRPVISELRKQGISDGSIMVSLERHMKCGIGKCGHCSIEHLYCCLDGPVFWFDEVAHVEGAL